MLSTDKDLNDSNMGIDHYCHNGRDQVDNLFTKDIFLRRRLFVKMTFERYVAFCYEDFITSNAFNDIRFIWNVFLLHRHISSVNTTNTLIIPILLYTSSTDSVRCSRLRNEQDILVFNLDQFQSRGSLRWVQLQSYLDIFLFNWD